MIQRTDSLKKTLILGKIEGGRRRDGEGRRREKGGEGEEDEMVGWHHLLYGHEFEQAPGVGDGQGSLAYFNLWGCKESDTTERLN